MIMGRLAAFSASGPMAVGWGASAVRFMFEVMKTNQALQTALALSKSLRAISWVKILALPGLTLSLAAAYGCDPAAATTSAALRGGGSVPDYVWGSVELVDYDQVGGIQPCVHVAPEVLDEHDAAELVMHTSVSYVHPQTGRVVLETFDVSLADTAITESEDAFVVEVGRLQLAAVPDEETLAVTAEVTTAPPTLPGLLFAEALGAQVNEAWGIIPCVRVSRAALQMSTVNEVSMTILASYQDSAGVMREDQIAVPLSSTRVTEDGGGALLVVEPTTPLQLSAEVDTWTLLVGATLAWQ